MMFNTARYSSTYLAIGFAHVRAGTEKRRGVAEVPFCIAAGYNVTLMAQTSEDDGRTWTRAAPMHGKITDGDFENVVDAPFGVEPKLQMLSSGVLVLSTGRPVLRLFSPCALLSHAQGSSGVVGTMPFAWARPCKEPHHSGQAGP